MSYPAVSYAQRTPANGTDLPLFAIDDEGLPHGRSTAARSSGADHATVPIGILAIFPPIYAPSSRSATISLVFA